MASNLFAFTPKGFLSSCEVLNCLPNDIVETMISSLYAQTINKESILRMYKLYLSSNSEITEAEQFTPAQLSGALNALEFIVACVSKQKQFVKEDIVSSLRANTSLLSEQVDVVATFISQAYSTTENTSLSLSKVVKCDWKLAVGIASDTCNELKAPHVSFMFQLHDGNNIRNHPIEMTIQQFQQFRATLQQLSVALQDA